MKQASQASRMKSTPTILKVVIILSLTGGAFYFAMMYHGYRLLYDRAAPAPGYGHPKAVETFQGGWKRYSFPELGWHFELPAPPAVIDPPSDRGLERQFCRGWSYYKASGRHLSALIRGFWSVSELNEGDTLVWANEELSSLRSVSSSIHYTSSKVTINGFPAGLGQATIVSHGSKSEVRAIYFSGSGLMRSIWFSYWSNDAEADIEWHRIVRSIEFGPYEDQHRQGHRRLDDLDPEMSLPDWVFRDRVHRR